MNGIMMRATRLTGAGAVAGGLLLPAACASGHRAPATVLTSPARPSAGSSSAAATSGRTSAGPVPGAVPGAQAGPTLPGLAAQSTYVQCLRQHGLPLTAADQEVLSPQQRVALQTCGSYLPGGVNGTVLKKVDQFRACMEKHGTPLPPPNQPFVLKTDDSKVAAALEACKSQLPFSGG